MGGLCTGAAAQERFQQRQLRLMMRVDALQAQTRDDSTLSAMLRQVKVNVLNAWTDKQLSKEAHTIQTLETMIA